jgi:hypothetical protein
MENNLPNGWAECRFGEVAKIHNGYASQHEILKEI